jgi:2-dehydro-3-deoxyphosphooctonate aldolase (KDO 8-P synthase)
MEYIVEIEIIPAEISLGDLDGIRQLLFQHILQPLPEGRVSLLRHAAGIPRARVADLRSEAEPQPEADPPVFVAYGGLLFGEGHPAGVLHAPLTYNIIPLGEIPLEEDQALGILKKVKDSLELPILTDIHTEAEAEKASFVADVLQIPAFLCRQTDLLLAAGKTGKAVNIKKGQFLAPEDMKHAVEKVASTNNKNILLTERGTTFGYHDLIVDMRSLIIMREIGFPVVMDATHSVQLPSKGGVSGGQPKFIPPLARAAVALGVDALFMEVHPDPLHALSDAASQFPLDKLRELLTGLKKIDSIVKNL